MIKIDKNIPIPSGRGNEKYPFRCMDVGDSVFCDCKYNPLSVAKRTGIDTGFKFVSRRVDGGFRVWRVE